MYKVVSIFHRKRELKVEGFQNYWLNVNSRIVKTIPGLQHYCQSHTLPSAYKKITPAADGIAEYWFNSYDDYRKFKASDIFEELTEDFNKFTEAKRTIEMTVREEVIKDKGINDRGVKSIEFVTKKNGMEVDAFQKYWKEVHGPLGASINTVNRYVQNHEVLDSYRKEVQPLLDGLAITWFDSTKKMRESALTQEYSNTRADEENFLTVPLEFIITTEHVIV